MKQLNCVSELNHQQCLPFNEKIQHQKRCQRDGTHAQKLKQTLEKPGTVRAGFAIL
jgi:hypothetical protein